MSNLWKRFTQLCNVLYTEAGVSTAVRSLKYDRRGFCHRHRGKPSSMTLQQFRSLPKDMQRTAVKRYGVFLFGRTGVGVHVMLYQLEGFYVEIYFDDKTSASSCIKSFGDTKRLDPYLYKVDVSALHPFLMK